MSPRGEVDEIDLRSLSAEAREGLMLQAAKNYYDLDHTMAEIAKLMGLTRWQVARLLKDAREQGVVRIEIVPHLQRRPDLESALQRRWSLRDAVVVRDAGDDDALMTEAVARAAGQWLAALTPRPPLVGVSWGRTMAAVAHWLPRRWNDGVEVVLLNGAMNIRAAATRTNNVAELFALAGNGRATLLPVPAIVGRAETRAVLERDPVIAGVLAMGREAPLVCFGLGAMSAGSVLVESGYLDERDIARLTRAGAVGDVLGRFIDADGRPVDPSLDDRTIGLGHDALPDHPLAVGVAAGARKHAVVLAALRRKLLNVLVTDETTAAAMLEGRRADG
ncbi:sugar-binding transcriptional regulator [Rhizosaccharibacter radicis]|uniref:Sugar-binding transcriptional regulator n=1 Tax=Rhizosaccharibacter radicis TaxID=2782605 RepID=A0ABT1W056_9PROT|nr:sugar-binding transcriptional regulator [Acetobacteraceae bacterium KSS12]